MLSPRVGSSTGLWRYSGCVKLGVSGVSTALLPCVGEPIASCDGKLLSFSELHQEKYVGMPVIISCKVSLSVVFLEYCYTFLKFQSNHLQASSM